MNKKYPLVNDLKKKAKKRIPKFAFEYLEGGCNEEINLTKNKSDLNKIQLNPHYIKKFSGYSLSTKIFDIKYNSPFGIAPIGLQGLIWPNSPIILAKAANKFNIPYVLSTVSTASIEEISEVSDGKAWFQLYYPAEEKIRIDILERAKNSGIKVLVLLCDVPSFGYRGNDIKNGLSMPPKMNINNFIQIIKNPTWAFNTLYFGKPNFATLKPYMPKNLNLGQLGRFMDQTFSGRLNYDRIAKIRDIWKDKLVIKGIVNELDTETSIKLGLDGIIISNHGGRQLDPGLSSIDALRKIYPKFKNKITIMMDSGIKSGPDIARSIACGAQFTFLGRSFMYGVGALGKSGGDHTIEILNTQLNQIMEQLSCENILDLKNHLIN
ncbi:MAG: alpha-hydroxy-acid oxidizing enzyme [Flavobacteriaceae bacterium]|nr:alpha-hydroxy-acid oxidizing enzyme [Flavobacteriaceae bacterium]